LGLPVSLEKTILDGLKGMAMVKTFRVLMANQPKLMRELLLEVLAEEPWIQIVGEATQEAQIRDLVLKTSPDLLVVTAEKPGKRPAICDELLHEFPALRIIAVAAQESYSVCYWASLDIHADDIEASEQGFLTAVRSVAETVSKSGNVN
jgi:chemotaxis response regulator CheB